MGIAELFTKYGTDKDLYHSYGPIYQSLFDGRENEVEMVLEIGVLLGQSLRAFRDHFPNALIVGIDLNQPQMDGERLSIVKADATDPFAMGVVGHNLFDLIIDDGSHQIEDQKASMRLLWGSVRPGGFYVIEDLQDDATSQYWRGFRSDGVVHDLRRNKGRYDDVIAVFTKRE